MEQVTPTMRPPALVLRLSSQAYATLEAVAERSGTGVVKQAEIILEGWARDRTAGTRPVREVVVGRES
jgi:hypothetical protein